MSPRAGLDTGAIVRAAAELADERGLDQVSLGALAERLRIRPPSLYNHVDGLPALRRRLALEGLAQLNERLTSAAVGRSGDDAVFALGEAYVGFVRARPGLYEAVFRTPPASDADLAAASGAVVEVCVRVMRSYGRGEEETLHLIRGLRSLLHGFASIEQAGGFGLPLDLDESLRTVLSTFLAGIRATGAAGEEAP
ncbi:TetR/AcrR family transcriptional regulator [Paenibacillus sp.]|uniref:TetR/AcrR family transcriptional regulator n=1 Tax=Paenibacillus sp. TaxID=58172 RepID=UPI002D5EA3C3|nr:WHG domain-containing protein [Paenibacillus sp.]HZG55240.1 WHG domain-containing protein [Paenibacillus sp.]